VSSLAPRGDLVRRSQDRALVDLGKAEGLAVGAKLRVLKKGSLDVKPEGLGYSYPPEAVIGEIELTRVGEEASEGKLKSSGFFDTVNVGDQVVLEPKAEAQAASAAKDKKAAGQASGERKSEWPALFNLVRTMR
jgi:hypothetical protein